MPPAARVGDMHACPAFQNIGGWRGVQVPHGGGPILAPGASQVLIGGQPAATVGTMALCVGPVDTVTEGSATVIIGGKPAARLGDPTAHQGTITAGLPTVLIGG